MTTWRVRTVSLLALLVGLSPLLVYNLDGQHTLRFVLDTLSGSGKRTSPLLSDMLAAMRRDFSHLLDGFLIGGRTGTAYRDLLAVPAFLAASATLVGLAVVGKLSYSVRKLALLAILLASLLLQSSLTTMGQGAEHLIIAWPIPQTLVAAAIISLVDNARDRRWVVALIGLCTLGIVASGALTTVRYHRSFAATEGQG
ncbi:MAG: hypothetical protein R2844_05335 [Caldilineales bacterium]